MSEMPEASFLTIVHMMGIHALVALGEIPNPITQEKSLDLRQARWQIKSLEVLQEKSRGNLSAEETKAIENVLFEVRNHYLEKSKTAR